MLATVEGLTTSEAARVLGVAAQTLRSWARQGRLPYTETPLGTPLYAPAEHQDREAAAWATFRQTLARVGGAIDAEIGGPQVFTASKFATWVQGRDPVYVLCRYDNVDPL